MVVEHEFTVPVPAGQVWPVLLDPERISSCVPGVTLTSTAGEEFEGRFRIRAGSVTVTYLGTARFTGSVEGDHRLVVVAAGRQARGTGTVDATIVVRLHDTDEGARVHLSTDVTVTGRLTSVDHGVLVGVGSRLLTRFASQLTGLLTTPVADPVTDPVTDPGVDPAAERPCSAPAAGRPPTPPPRPPPRPGHRKVDRSPVQRTRPTGSAPALREAGRNRPTPPPFAGRHGRWPSWRCSCCWSVDVAAALAPTGNGRLPATGQRRVMRRRWSRIGPTARSTGVWPASLSARVSAPAASNSSADRGSAFCAAQCNGVQPPC